MDCMYETTRLGSQEAKGARSFSVLPTSPSPSAFKYDALFLPCVLTFFRVLAGAGLSGYHSGVAGTSSVR